MSLNDIKLNAQLLADLYPDVLVQDTVTTSVPEPVSVSFLGYNSMQVLILVNYASVPFLPDRELAFLTSILSACKMGLADVAIVNLSKSDKNHIKNIEAKKVIMFGVEPSEIGLPIHFPNFQIQKFDTRTYFSSPSLSEVENDKTVKMKLWNCLKNLFGI